MGATASNPVPPVASATPVVEKPAEAAAKTASACPMGFGKKGDDSDRCPVKSKSGDKYKNPNVFNVYSQKIDPTNQMPAVANQQPSKEQMVALPTERVSSTIPKGGTDNETWLYPSPQMVSLSILSHCITHTLNSSGMHWSERRKPMVLLKRIWRL